MTLNDATQMLRIIRPHIVAGGILAFTLGVLLAAANGGTFDLGKTALFYAVVFLGDLSTHYSNDYFDTEADKHIKRKKYFSGSYILVDNPQFRPLARLIAIIFLTLSCGFALVMVFFQVAPVELLFITVVANLLGWLYSAPPVRLISRGLGETAIALAAGFAIPAVGYLSVRGQLDLLFAFFSFPFMLCGLILSLSLEAPDIEVDQKTGKRNFAVRKGERAVSGTILAAALMATLLFLVYIWQFGNTLMNLGIVAVFSAIPLAAALAQFAWLNQKKHRNRLYAANVIALFFFNAAMIAYLATVVANT